MICLIWALFILCIKKRDTSEVHNHRSKTHHSDTGLSVRETEVSAVDMDKKGSQGKLGNDKPNVRSCFKSKLRKKVDQERNSVWVTLLRGLQTRCLCCLWSSQLLPMYGRDPQIHLCTLILWSFFNGPVVQFCHIGPIDCKLFCYKNQQVYKCCHVRIKFVEIIKIIKCWDFLSVIKLVLIPVTTQGSLLSGTIRSCCTLKKVSV